MAEAARVIRMYGDGHEQMVDAIQSGMLSVDAERAYRGVLEENKRLRKENRVLKERLAVVQESRRNERRDRAEAYRMVLSRDAEYQRTRDWRIATGIGLVSLGGVLVALATAVVLL